MEGTEPSQGPAAHLARAAVKRGDLVRFAGAWSFLRVNRQYEDALNDAYRIDRALECARRLADEELAKHKNPFGLIDLGKTFCAGRTFLASMEEIRGTAVEPIQIGFPSSWSTP